MNFVNSTLKLAAQVVHEVCYACYWAFGIAVTLAALLSMIIIMLAVVCVPALMLAAPVSLLTPLTYAESLALVTIVILLLEQVKR